MEVVFNQQHPSQSEGDGEEKEQAGKKSVLNTEFHELTHS